MRKHNFIHGHANSRKKQASSTYTSWLAMKVRCTDPRSKSYPLYGGRGIRMADRWATFANFLADVGERPPGTTLDRIDNAGNYEPGNCRWSGAIEQQRNRRNNRLITFRGETKPLVAWAAQIGISEGALRARITRCGWSIESALTMPLFPREARRVSKAMKAILVGAAIVLSGCSQLAGNTPSLQYCSEVHYNRTGNQIEVQAKCQAPIGSSLLH